MSPENPSRAVLHRFRQERSQIANKALRTSVEYAADVSIVIVGRRKWYAYECIQSVVRSCMCRLVVLRLTPTSNRPPPSQRSLEE